MHSDTSHFTNNQTYLRNFVYTNPDYVKNCLTPDCKMVYKITEEGTKFLCSLCGVTICTKCHVQYHDDLTCAMYQSVTRQGDDSSVDD